MKIKNEVTRNLTGLLLAGLLAVVAIPAHAGTIGISGGKLIVGTEAGDGDQVFDPSIVGGNLVLPNLNFDIVTPGCTGGASIVCPLTGFQELDILGGAGDDVIQLSDLTGFTFPVIALGGPGADVLIGTPGNVKLFGGPGDDILISKTGNCFSRGTGADVVLGAGCDAGPDPTISPLPRATADAPEPGGIALMLTGLIALVYRRTNRAA